MPVALRLEGLLRITVLPQTPIKGASLISTIYTTGKRGEVEEDMAVRALNTKDCNPPNLIGYEEDGKSYQLYKNGTAYAGLMVSDGANSDAVMGKFIKEHAESVTVGSI
jgi:hypothetical protein